MRIDSTKGFGSTVCSNTSSSSTTTTKVYISVSGQKKNLNRVLKIKNYFEKDYYVLELKVLDKMEMYV